MKFQYFSDFVERMQEGEPSNPKELESIMSHYDGANEQKQAEIKEILSWFPPNPCHLIAEHSFGVPMKTYMEERSERASLEGKP